MMNLYLSKSRNFRGVLVVLLVFVTSGCSNLPYNVDFSLKERGFRPVGKSIAVISGTKDPMNIELAKRVSDSLRKESRYQVASPARVARTVKPQKIKGPYKSAYMVIDTDWDLGDRKKIADIQRALGVDYLYVVWAPIIANWNGQKEISISAVAQLFERPDAKEVAETEMSLLAGDKKNVYFKKGVDEVARQLAEQTHMLVDVKK